MRINADFEETVTLATEEMAWVDSPMPGVQRRMLDRVGAESGHATTIVRYAANSYFSSHTHEGGEEFLVLEGTFSDEHGDYPAGTYVRNPIATHHRPFSAKGCIIFVKLFQFAESDTEQFHIDTTQAQTGVLALHQFADEQVKIVTIRENDTFSPQSGFELLLLAGELSVASKILPKGSWFRTVRDDILITTSLYARFYIKTGHL